MAVIAVLIVPRSGRDQADERRVIESPRAEIARQRLLRRIGEKRDLIDRIECAFIGAEAAMEVDMIGLSTRDEAEHANGAVARVVLVVRRLVRLARRKAGRTIANPSLGVVHGEDAIRPFNLVAIACMAWRPA